MKTDPDFHPLAAKWLDGKASAPEQAVFQDILSADARAMEEYAALCRTEIMLQQTARDTAARRQFLEALLAGKPWPKRLAAFCAGPRIRQSAAAAAVVLGSWAVWQLGTGRGLHASGFAKNSPALSPLRIPGNPGAKSPHNASADEDDVSGNIDPKLRQLLERMAVTDFKAHGTLSELVAESFSQVKGLDGETIPVRVLDEGDAPLFLEFTALMPAWHLLKLMALQTGTKLEMEDGALVFRRAEKPESPEDRTTRSANLNALRALLGLRERNQDGDMPSKYAAMVARTLGSSLTFETDSQKSIKVSGSSRDVKVLNAALTAALAFPVKTNLSVFMIKVPAYVYAKAYDSPPENSPAEDAASLSVNPLDNPSPAVIAEILKASPQPTLKGAFTAEQYAIMLRAMLQKKDFQFKALMDQPVTANQENLAVSVETLPDGTRVTGEASVIVKPGDKTITLDTTTLMNLMGPGDLREDNEGMNFQVMLWSGQTAGFGDFKKPDGSAVVFYITASTPDEPQGQEAAAGALPAASEELAALPVSGKPGFVTSPYSEVAIQFDVSSLKHGSRFTCPLTGRKFRIP